MKITEREEILMRRALDPASSPAEAEMAAQGRCVGRLFGLREGEEPKELTIDA
jgi:hypothetical protein